MLLNEEQELEQDALLAQLGIPPPPRPDAKTKNAKMLEALRALVDAGKPQSSRSILDGIDPMLGPTRAREVKRTVDDHLRSQLASSPPRQAVTPSGTIQLPPQAGMFGASTPFPAMVSGVASKLFDDPTDIKGAVIEGMGRGAVAPYQDDVPTVSGEFKQRGYDPGMVGGFLLDAVTDPSNLLGGEADDVAKAGAAGLPLLLKKLLGKGALTDDIVKAVQSGAKHLNPAEQAALTKPEGMRSFLSFRNAIPDIDTLAGGVEGGAAKRGWYEHSRKAIGHVWGPDADLFAGVLAATSPQNAVETNFTNANNIFSDWVKAGRPTDGPQIEALMRDTIRRTTKDGEGKTLKAWVNNTVRVLQDSKTLSGSKVDSFWTNLRTRVRETPYGDVPPEQAVTLDAWMANLFGAHKEAFGSASSKAKLKRGDPGYSPNYLGGTSRMREVAEKMGIDPAEAQETLWSFGKSLYEQSEATGVTAREIIEKGQLSQQRLLETPDFAELYRQMGHDVPDYGSLPPIMQAPDAQAAMLKLADNLDALRNRRQMATQLKTAAPQDGTVMATVPMEGRTGGNAATTSAFKGKTAKARDQMSSRLLGRFEDVAGRNKLFEALFPGQTTDIVKGRGDWLDGVTNKRQNNLLQTLGVRVPTTEGGTMIDPAAEGALRFGTDMQSTMLGQDAGVHSATSFAPGVIGDGSGANVVRTWPSSSAANFPEAGFLKLRNKLAKQSPGNDYALNHRTEGGVDVLKLGGAMSPEERELVMRLSKGSVGHTKKTPASAEAGVNIADQNNAYRDYGWKPEVGQRNVTTQVVGEGSDWTRLSPAQQAAADATVKQVAPELMRDLSKFKNRPDYVNYLRILSEGGVTGLAKALGDPTQLLPVLAMLGLGSALLPRSTGQTPEPE